MLIKVPKGLADLPTGRLADFPPSLLACFLLRYDSLTERREGKEREGKGKATLFDAELESGIWDMKYRIWSMKYHETGRETVRMFAFRLREGSPGEGGSNEGIRNYEY